MARRMTVRWILISILVVIGECARYDGCDPDDYYSSISPFSATQAEIGNLLKSTHRKVLPYTSNDEDTWDALSDLDEGDTPGSVRLIYAQTSVVAYDFASQSRSWNREHLWPKSHGVGYTLSKASFTDVHHLRPADVNVNSARSNKYFSDCGIASDLSECRIPAHSEAEDTTATDPNVWLPPETVRGDIARALFYMEYRYFGDGDDPDLELTDCPTIEQDTKLAYLSQLLQWHLDDPVDEHERARNHRVCEHWQGNRNIFVDFPELVTSLYGSPQNLDASNEYQCNSNTPTPAPPNTKADVCGALRPGDIQVIGVHSDNPDQVALVALDDISAGLELMMTDDAWTGIDFRGTEGKAKLTIPENGFHKGTIFGYGESNLDMVGEWTGGSLALSTGGDSIILYCQKVDSTYNFLSALTYDGSWVSSDFDSNKSALPATLENVNTVLDHQDNYKYVGPIRGSKDDLIEAIGDSSNWIGSNTALSFDFEPFSVCIGDCDPAPNDGANRKFSFGATVVLGLVAHLML